MAKSENPQSRPFVCFNNYCFIRFVELTTEQQKVLIEIRRRKTVLLLEIQVSSEHFFQTGIHINTKTNIICHPMHVDDICLHYIYKLTFMDVYSIQYFTGIDLFRKQYIQ